MPYRHNYISNNPRNISVIIQCCSLVIVIKERYSRGCRKTAAMSRIMADSAETATADSAETAIFTTHREYF